MRWLFLLVLSLNLAYIAWGLSSKSVDPYKNVPPLKNVAPIILLSELEQPALVAEGEQAETMTAVVQQEEALPDASQVAVADVTVANVPVVADEAETIEKPDAAAEGTISPTVSAADAAMPVASCYTLGPFRDIEKLRGLTRDIKGYVASADFRGTEEKEQSMYWVYLPPEVSHSDAVATGKRLRAKKIKDFYIIPDGEKIHGLSLGYFRNKDGAYGLVEKVRKSGFDVEIEPVFKTYTNYWLDYRLVDDVDIPEAILDKYIAIEKGTKISRLTRDCAE